MTEGSDLEDIYATLHAADWMDVDALKKLEMYHRTWAIPAACLIFGFIGVPLGVRSGSAGRIGGIGVGVAGILFYYLLNILCDFFRVDAYINAMACRVASQYHISRIIRCSLPTGPDQLNVTSTGMSDG